MMLVQYIKRGIKRKGVIVAFTEPGTENIYIGWSLCHPNDSFDKDIGKDIAINRAIKWHYHIKNRNSLYDPKEINHLTVPISIDQQLYKFILRAERYFKNLEVSSWIDIFKKYTGFKYT